MQRVWKFDTFFHRLGAPVEDALPRGQKTGRPIVLDDHTRTTLARWLRSGKTTIRMAKRVQALLLLAPHPHGVLLALRLRGSMPWAMPDTRRGMQSKALEGLPRPADIQTMRERS